MITDVTTTADFLFGFLLVHRNLGFSSKEHRDFWFSTTKMVSLSLHVGYSFAPTPPRWTPRDRYGVFTRSYEELRKLDAIDAVAPSRRRRRRSLSFSRICATRYALSRPTETTIESFMRSIVVVNMVVVVVVSEEWWRKKRNGQRNASWNTGKTLF